jgi:hypothetical protein
VAITPANLITLAPELAAVDNAILVAALAAVPQLINLDPNSSPFADKADLLTTYLALHVLAMMGYGKASQGRVVSKGAAGVSVTYATVAAFKVSDLESTPWGALYKLAVRGYGFRGAVT